MTDVDPIHSFYVALAVICLMSTVLIVVLLRYSGEKIEKPLSTLAGLFGTILGAIGTFYFGQKNVKNLETEVERKDVERINAMDFCRRDYQDLYEELRAAQDELRAVKQRLGEDAGS